MPTAYDKQFTVYTTELLLESLSSSIHGKMFMRLKSICHSHRLRLLGMQDELFAFHRLNDKYLKRKTATMASKYYSNI